MNRIITDQAVIDVTANGLILKEVAKGYSIEEILSSTEPDLLVAKDVKLEAY